MTKFLKKEIKFNWIDRCKEHFRDMKEMLTITPIFMLPKVGETFTVYIDASREDYRRVLI